MYVVKDLIRFVIMKITTEDNKRCNTAVGCVRPKLEEKVVMTGTGIALPSTMS